MNGLSLDTSILLHLQQRADKENCSVEELLKRLLSAENSFHLAQAKLQAVMDSTIWAFVFLDLDYRVLELNDYAKETSKLLWGKSLQRGDILIDFLPEGMRESSRHNFALALLGTPTVTNRIFKDVEGRERFFEVRLHRMMDYRSRAIGVCLSYQDITHREYMLHAFNQSEARLHSLVETQSAFVVRSNLEGQYTYANASFAKRYSWMVDNLIGVSLLETVHPDDHEKALSTAYACLAEPGKPIQVVLHKITPDDSMFWTLWEFVAIKNEDDIVSEIQCIGFDISEQIEIENSRIEQLTLTAKLKKEQEFNALVQKVVSSLSHDVRIPLAVIGSAKNMLERYYNQLDDEGRHEKLNRIGNQLRYVTEMLDDVVMTVRGGLNPQIFKPVPLNLSTLCQVSVQEIQQTAGVKHHLHFVTDERVQTVMVDETLINRILLNLLSNAVKFSPVESDISLELYRREEWIVLRVTDHGMGIAEDDLVHLFEPFYRADAAKPIAGTGLGLSIVKECVERHQGMISVQSKLGAGTSFTVEIPLQLESSS